MEMSLHRLLLWVSNSILHHVLCAGALFQVMWPTWSWPQKLCESKNNAPTFLVFSFPLFRQNLIYFCPFRAFAHATSSFHSCRATFCPFRPIPSFLQDPDHVDMWYLFPCFFRTAFKQSRHNDMSKKTSASSQKDAESLCWSLSIRWP